MRSDTLQLFQTAPQRCGYYPERIAQNLRLDPAQSPSPALYDRALAHGFRRSGEQLYRPHCPQCQACTPARIEVARFRPDRSQRRNLRANQALVISLHPAAFSQERFALYARYVRWRHPGGGMDQTSPSDFRDFLLARWSPTWFMEFRLDGELVAVAVTDIVAQGLSAVYTFYAPEQAGRGLGTLAVLQQIALARQRALPWVYLGFWLDGHPKMDYKRRFQPLQLLHGAHWRPMAASAST